MAKISNPRWLWITALLVAAVCIGAFAHAMLAPAEPSAPGPAPVADAGTSGSGFGAGLVIGLGAGIAVGLAIARQRNAVVETQPASLDHSSRKSP